MKPKDKGDKLVRIYFFICDMFEELKYCEQFSNNNQPELTDQEIMTIYLLLCNTYFILDGFDEVDSSIMPVAANEIKNFAFGWKSRTKKYLSPGIIEPYTTDLSYSGKISLTD